jgi:hypothetical protein
VIKRISHILWCCVIFIQLVVCFLFRRQGSRIKAHNLLGDNNITSQSMEDLLFILSHTICCDIGTPKNRPISRPLRLATCMYSSSYPLRHISLSLSFVTGNDVAYTLHTKNVIHVNTIMQCKMWNWNWHTRFWIYCVYLAVKM